MPLSMDYLAAKAASGAGKAKGASLDISEFVAGIIQNGGGHYGYSSSHNRGSVENGVLEDVFSLQMFYFPLP